MHGLKTKLEHVGGSWVEELPNILWPFRTTPRRATDATPFSIVYGIEAVLPVKIGIESARIATYSPDDNEIVWHAELDLIKEKRMQAFYQPKRCHSQVAHAYNQRVVPRSFQVGDLVMRKVLPEGSRGKLGPKWEGPFHVERHAGIGAYYLRDAQGNLLARPWNMYNLCPYFSG